MKKSQFAEEQIIKILQEAEAGAETIENICRKHSISEQTFYRWRHRYGGMSVPDATRLRELERENTRLKKLVAERDLEIEVMKEVAAKKW
jgi:putative transposase